MSEGNCQMGQWSYLYGSDIRGVDMDMVYDACYLCLFVSGFCLLLGIWGWVFELVYKYVPVFKNWVDDFIGDDCEESEV